MLSVSNVKLQLQLKLERVQMRQISDRTAEWAGSTAKAFGELAPWSLYLVGSPPVSGQPGAVNVLLPTVSKGSLFAGVRTALDFAVRLAKRLDWRVRVLSFSGPATKQDLDVLRNLLEREFGLREQDWSVVAPSSLGSFKYGEDDIWIATYWTTSHALDVRSRLGLVDPKRVLYLIQDLEPSFFPASTYSFVAESTYKAGFIPVVNSSPLAHALWQTNGVRPGDPFIFAPQLDYERLAAVASQRACERPSRTVLFYGRPSKPRNMYSLGLATLRRLFAVPGVHEEFEFLSVGERHRDVPLAKGHVLRSLGPLSWARYFDGLAGASVMLSLQASPHPSHPPLDMVVSGAHAVTNEVGGSRDGLHDRLLVAYADPEALADKLTGALNESMAGVQGVFDAGFIRRLGRPLDDVVESSALAIAG